MANQTSAYLRSLAVSEKKLLFDKGHKQSGKARIDNRKQVKASKEEKYARRQRRAEKQTMTLAKNVVAFQKLALVKVFTSVK